MTRRRFLIAGWIVVLGLSAALPLSALFHGIVHLGPAPLIARGPLARPVIAIGADVQLPRGSRSVVVAVLGNIEVHGHAEDDLVALGGRVYLAPGTHVDGDVLALLGGIYRAPHVAASGRLGGSLVAWNGKPEHYHRSPITAIAWATRLGLAAGLALLLVGMCLTIVFPWQVVLISSTLRTAPLKSGAAGLFCLLTFAFLVIPLGLSLAGLPFALLLSGAASLAWLFGVTASAVVLGRTLARNPVSLLWATAAGMVVLALGMAVPVVGPVLVTLVGVTGAGALAVALLSRSRPPSPIA
jgi:hypothetical protein